MLKNKKSAVCLLGIILVCVAAVSLTVGQIDMPVKNTLAVVFHQLGLPFFTAQDFTREQLAVVWFIRMPRMLVGVLVGAALGISGAVMQSVLRNPLASSYTLGVSSGASLGAAFVLLLGVQLPLIPTMTRSGRLMPGVSIPMRLTISWNIIVWLHSSTDSCVQ